MINKQDRKEQEQVAPKIMFTLPVSVESLEVVMGITKEIEMVTGGDFGRSLIHNDSFYPRITLFSLSDVRQSEYPTRLKSVVEESAGELWRGSGTIKRFRRTDGGLLLMELDVSQELLDEKEKLANRLAGIRTGTAPGKYGYKYFDDPLHITMGANISSEQFELLNQKLLEKHAGKVISFDSLEIFMNSDWNTNHPIEVI